MRELLSRAIDLLYPRVCANCERVGGSWCAACLAQLDAYPVTHIQRALPSGLTIIAASPHDGLVRSAIHAFKFENTRELAEPLAALLVAVLRDAAVPVDALVPVPLHSQREAWRGYNQSLLLAGAVAERLGLPCIDALIRTRSTGTQVGRSAEERRAAVQGAFSADASSVVQRHLLLIDDVVTTGSTLDACADALLAAGAASVMAACVASA